MNKDLQQAPSTLLSLAKFALPRRGSFETLDSIELDCLSIKGAVIDEKMLRRYEQVCGLSSQEYSPVLFPQVLASPLQLALLSDAKFPVSMLGAVHKRNQIVQSQVIGLRQKFDLTVSLATVRIVKKGIEFDVSNRITSPDGEMIWESLSTFFVQKKRPENLKFEKEPSFDFDVVSEETGAKCHRWLLSKEKGREYARITGDYNPIHVSKWAAKAFGFKRDLAHGFCLLATCLEKVPETSASQLNNQLYLGARHISVDVEFKGPNYLGEDIKMWHQRAGFGHRLNVFCGENSRPTLLVRIKGQ